MSARVHVHAYPVGPFQSNTYFISEGSEAVVVDPGDEPARAAAYAREQDLKVRAILLTHGHLDHIGGVAELERVWDVDSFVHPADRFLVDTAPRRFASFGLPAPPQPARLRDLRGGDRFAFGEGLVETAETPGHSPGHVIFKGPGFAVVGDLIFAGSVGRTDLEGGDTQTLLRSIEQQVLTLPDPTVLYPGHGPATTVGAERNTNPFLAPGALG